MIIEKLLNARIRDIAIVVIIIFACFPIAPISILNDSVIRVWATRGSYAVILIYSIVNFRHIPVSTVCSVVYGIVLLMSAATNHTDKMEAFAVIYPLIGVTLLVECGISKFKADFVVILQRVLFYEVLITLILFPVSDDLFGEGNFFIGGENRIVFTTMAAFTMTVIRFAFNRCSTKYVVRASVICSLLTVLNFSGGSVVGWAVYAALLLMLIYFKRLNSFISLIKAYTAYILLWVGLVLFRIQNHFSYLIETVLGKSMTLTHRTDVWDLVLRNLDGHYLLGYGLQGTDNLFTISGQYGSGKNYTLTLSSHNFILQTIYTGGTLSLVPLAACIAISSFRLTKLEDPLLRAAMVSWVIGISIVMLVEAVGVVHLLFPLSVANGLFVLLGTSSRR